MISAPAIDQRAVGPDDRRIGRSATFDPRRLGQFHPAVERRGDGSRDEEEDQHQENDVDQRDHWLGATAGGQGREGHGVSFRTETASQVLP